MNKKTKIDKWIDRTQTTQTRWIFRRINLRLKPIHSQVSKTEFRKWKANKSRDGRKSCRRWEDWISKVLTLETSKEGDSSSDKFPNHEIIQVRQMMGLFREIVGLEFRPVVEISDFHTFYRVLHRSFRGKFETLIVFISSRVVSFWMRFCWICAENV